MPRFVLAPLVTAFVLLASLSGGAAIAAAPSPTPKATPAKPYKSHARTLGHAGLRGTSPNHPVSAAACNSRAVTMQGTPGQLGPNGASRSQTVVAIPINGKDTAAATQQQQINEACSHIRR